MKEDKSLDGHDDLKASMRTYSDQNSLSSSFQLHIEKAVLEESSDEKPHNGQQNASLVETGATSRGSLVLENSRQNAFSHHCSFTDVAVENNCDPDDQINAVESRSYQTHPRLCLSSSLGEFEHHSSQDFEQGLISCSTKYNGDFSKDNLCDGRDIGSDCLYADPKEIRKSKMKHPIGEAVLSSADLGKKTNVP